eukprot:TRINITY_DN1246_c0_g1_i3.p1 TRINITY_DN1246_c0_g1~~TRINITY_DN1246_c0_g1_i3.p1  ORF type:complete len:1129 (+),score=201.52 TRINITY_DN1246_c0_g1_i3:275-3388(+)
MCQLFPYDSHLPYVLTDTNNDTVIFIAARCGHTHMLKHFSDVGRDLRLPNSSAQKPIHIAINNNDSQMLLYLLKLYDKLSSVEGNDYSLLHRAAVSGATSCIPILIRNGATTDIINPSNGTTPLVRSLLNGQIEAARVLLSLGANINFVDEHKRTPIFWLSTTQRFEETRFVAQQGAQINDQDANGFRPLHYAAKEGNAGMIKVLLELGADPLATSQQKTIALHWAVHSGKAEAVAALLTDRESSKQMIRAKDIDGSSAYLWGVESGSIEILHLLEDAGFSADDADSKGITSLMIACMKGNKDVCTHIIDEKVPLDARDFDGWTALHHASFHGKDAILSLLLKSGAPVDIVGRNGMTPAHCAASKGHIACLNVLASKSKEALLALDEHKRSCLHWACMSGNPVCVEYLIGSGVPLEGRDYLQRTPFLVAAGYGHTMLMQILMSKGADVRVIDMSGLTAFHHVAQKNLASLIHSLSKANTYISAKTTSPCLHLPTGSSPLHVAIHSSSFDAALELIYAGAFLYSVDSAKTIPLELATKRFQTGFLCRVFSELAKRESAEKTDSKKKPIDYKHVQLEIPVANKDKPGVSWSLVINLSKMKLRREGKTQHKIRWKEGPTCRQDSSSKLDFELVFGLKGPTCRLSCDVAGRVKLIRRLIKTMSAKQQAPSVKHDESVMDNGLSSTINKVKGKSRRGSTTVSQPPPDLGGTFYLTEFTCFLNGNPKRLRQLTILDGTRIKLKKGHKTKCKGSFSDMRLELDPVRPKKFKLYIRGRLFVLEAKSADELEILVKSLSELCPSLFDKPENELKRTASVSTSQMPLDMPSKKPLQVVEKKDAKPMKSSRANAKRPGLYDLHDNVGYSCAGSESLPQNDPMRGLGREVSDDEDDSDDGDDLSEEDDGDDDDDDDEEDSRDRTDTEDSSEANARDRSASSSSISASLSSRNGSRSASFVSGPSTSSNSHLQASGEPRRLSMTRSSFSGSFSAGSGSLTSRSQSSFAAAPTKAVDAADIIKPPAMPILDGAPSSRSSLRIINECRFHNE